jgi:exopolyphosphatase/guanosine-5'-triphosphate,3'-diphosphate pyrophosphatase
MKRKNSSSAALAPAPVGETGGNPPARLCAVIDIGSTSIRMVIAQIDEHHKVHLLESLQQTVSIGRDTFTKGYIERSTIEECVRVIGSFRAKCNEYRITDIKTVATSAVREATNREQFVERLYIASGITIETIDEAEIHRFTFLGTQTLLEEEKIFKNSNVIIVEAGGGSTEVLSLKKGRVDFAKVFRLGSFRLREMLEHYRAPDSKFRQIVQSQIKATIQQICAKVGADTAPRIIAMGGDIRVAAQWLHPDWNRESLLRLSVRKLEIFTDKIMKLSSDELVRIYKLAYPDAETLGPSLMVYLMLARAYSLQTILVTSISMRDGILAEMRNDDTWSPQFEEQIVSSARLLAKKYDVDATHAGHIASIAQKLFGALSEKHGLSGKYSLLLHIAALLHEVGLYVSTGSHHKHSMYLIQNSPLFGLGTRDVAIVALVVRYHRRALPTLAHPEYRALSRDDRIVVLKLAALLRLADSLDVGRTQSVRDLSVMIEDAVFVLTTATQNDITMEQMSLVDQTGLFEQVYGMKVLFKQS